jgi:hypothetical protein
MEKIGESMLDNVEKECIMKQLLMFEKNCHQG